MQYTLFLLLQITGGPNSASLDISPSQGQVTFNDQENSMNFTLSILPDNFPENNETFNIRLVNPTGGALISETSSQAQLVIRSNDSPVRFSSADVEVSESNGTVELLVYRGNINGSQVGPLNQVTIVQYSTASGTATTDEDFTSSSGTVTFESGVSNIAISIPIINDTSPEGDETFTVTLSSVSSDAVLQSPVTVTVVIGVNDNAGGIVGFQSTTAQTISEDEQTIATFIVQRLGAFLGDLTVSYSIKDSSNQLATSDFSPSSGTVTIPNGMNQTSLLIHAMNDTLPEELETFTVSIDAIVGGAGELSNQTLRVAMLYVADSDDVYGVIEVASSGAITVTSVSDVYSMYFSE